MPSKPILWTLFILSLVIVIGAAAGLLLPAQATPGYLAGMAGLLVAGLAGATISKLLLWTHEK